VNQHKGSCLLLRCCESVWQIITLQDCLTSKKLIPHLLETWTFGAETNRHIHAYIYGHTIIHFVLIGSVHAWSQDNHSNNSYNATRSCSWYEISHYSNYVTPSSQTGPQFDIIFSDYLGLEGLKQTGLFNRYQCRVRVLDTFGSEASG